MEAKIQELRDLHENGILSEVEMLVEIIILGRTQNDFAGSLVAKGALQALEDRVA